MKIEKILTVAITTFNYERYIENAVKSVLKCNNLNYIDLIVIDDGSTDNTRKRVKKYNCLKYFYKKNGGPSSARNFIISKVKTPFLIFLDADDELIADSLDKAIINLKSIQDNECVCIFDHIAKFSSKEKYIHNGGVTENNFLNLKNYLFSKKLKILNGATIFPTKLFKLGNYPEQYRSGEDIPIAIQAILNFNISYHNYALLKYSHHGDSLRHNTKYFTKDIIGYIEECFNPKRVNTKSKKINLIKKEFLSQKLLSMSRQRYIDNNYAECISYFKEAIKFGGLKRLFKFSYLRKYIYAQYKLLKGL